MASTEKESVDQQHCVLCCDDIDFSACGSCDHPICLKCCVKLRMLRKENDCPVCRAQLKEVIVSKGFKSWATKSLKSRPRQHFRNFGILHESPESQAKVDELLHHNCSECGEIFKSFPLVKDHVRKTHQRYYCDICLRHLRLFTHERKCYTREALVRHRKNGDLDDKSHRGHPLCKFCDDRYLDNDELLSHLRKNHFWCHLCEKDGCQDYFPEYKELRNHFRQSHFLCEEGECIDEKFTSVFRSKIDYQAHTAQNHSDKLSKAEARQARQVEINFRFVPRQTDTISVVSDRDYSFPEQRNERYAGRRLGNRERASVEASGCARQDSFPRGQSDDGSRPARNKGRDRDAGKSTKDLRQDKEKSKNINPKAAEQDKGKNRNNDRVAKGPTQDRGSNKVMDSGRTSRDGKKNGDYKGTLRDAVNGMKSMDVSHDKQKDGDVMSGSKDVVQDVSQKSNNLKNNHQTSQSQNLGGGETSKKAEKMEAIPEQTKNTANNGNANRSVDSSSKTKADTPKYGDDDFPALTSTVEQAASSKAGPSANRSVDTNSQLKAGTPKYSDNDFPALTSTVEQPASSKVSSLKFKAGTPKYSANDFPALTSTVEQPASSKAGPSVQTSKQPVSNQSTRKKAAVTSTVKVPTTKRNYNNEFPSLSAMSNKEDVTNSAVKAPPGLPAPGPRRPPPGLKWSVPPPGLAPTGNGMASVVNTGNSSAGPSKRDQQLIREINNILDCKGQSFLRFKEVSGQFRNGNLSAEGYYHECCGMLGEDVHRVFKALIDLLPDEEKQRQLLAVYNDAKIQSKQVKPEISVSSTQHFTYSNNASSTDVYLHAGDFPALPRSSGKNPMRSQRVADAWVHGR